MSAFETSAKADAEVRTSTLFGRPKPRPFPGPEKPDHPSASEPLLKTSKRTFRFAGDDRGYFGDADQDARPSKLYSPPPLSASSGTRLRAAGHRVPDDPAATVKEGAAKTERTSIFEDPKAMAKVMGATALGTIVVSLLTNNIKQNLDETQNLNAAAARAAAVQQAAMQQAMGTEAALQAPGSRIGHRSDDQPSAYDQGSKQWSRAVPLAASGDGPSPTTAQAEDHLHKRSVLASVNPKGASSDAEQARWNSPVGSSNERLGRQERLEKRFDILDAVAAVRERWERAADYDSQLIREMANNSGGIKAFLAKYVAVAVGALGLTALGVYRWVKSSRESGSPGPTTPAPAPNPSPADQSRPKLRPRSNHVELLHQIEPPSLEIMPATVHDPDWATTGAGSISSNRGSPVRSPPARVPLWQGAEVGRRLEAMRQDLDVADAMARSVKEPVSKGTRYGKAAKLSVASLIAVAVAIGIVEATPHIVNRNRALQHKHDVHATSGQVEHQSNASKHHSSVVQRDLQSETGRKLLSRRYVLRKRPKRRGPGKRKNKNHPAEFPKSSDQKRRGARRDDPRPGKSNLVFIDSEHLAKRTIPVNVARGWLEQSSRTSAVRLGPILRKSETNPDQTAADLIAGLVMFGPWIGLALGQHLADATRNDQSFNRGRKLWRRNVPAQGADVSRRTLPTRFGEEVLYGSGSFGVEVAPDQLAAEVARSQPNLKVVSLVAGTAALTLGGAPLLWYILTHKQKEPKPVHKRGLGRTGRLERRAGATLPVEESYFSFKEIGGYNFFRRHAQPSRGRGEVRYLMGKDETALARIRIVVPSVVRVLDKDARIRATKRRQRKREQAATSAEQKRVAELVRRSLLLPGIEDFSEEVLRLLRRVRGLPPDRPVVRLGDRDAPEVRGVGTLVILTGGLSWAILSALTARWLYKHSAVGKGMRRRKKKAKEEAAHTKHKRDIEMYRRDLTLPSLNEMLVRLQTIFRRWQRTGYHRDTERRPLLPVRNPGRAPAPRTLSPHASVAIASVPVVAAVAGSAAWWYHKKINRKGADGRRRRKSRGMRKTLRQKRDLSRHGTGERMDRLLPLQDLKRDRQVRLSKRASGNLSEAMKVAIDDFKSLASNSQLTSLERQARNRRLLKYAAIGTAAEAIKLYVIYLVIKHEEEKKFRRLRQQQWQQQPTQGYTYPQPDHQLQKRSNYDPRNEKDFPDALDLTSVSHEVDSLNKRGAVNNGPPTGALVLRVIRQIGIGTRQSGLIGRFKLLHAEYESKSESEEPLPSYPGPPRHQELGRAPLSPRTLAATISRNPIWQELQVDTYQARNQLGPTNDDALLGRRDHGAGAPALDKREVPWTPGRPAPPDLGAAAVSDVDKAIPPVHKERLGDSGQYHVQHRTDGVRGDVGQPSRPAKRGLATVQRGLKEKRNTVLGSRRLLGGIFVIAGSVLVYDLRHLTRDFQKPNAKPHNVYASQPRAARNAGLPQAVDPYRHDSYLQRSLPPFVP